jgi:hypothetical protein
MLLEHKVHVYCLSCYYHHKTIPRYPLTESNNKITTTISNMPTTWSAICHHPKVGDKYHICLGSISQIRNQDGFLV